MLENPRKKQRPRESATSALPLGHRQHRLERFLGCRNSGGGSLGCLSSCPRQGVCTSPMGTAPQHPTKKETKGLKAKTPQIPQTHWSPRHIQRSPREMGRLNTRPSQHRTKVPGILCSTPQKPGTRRIDPSTAGTPDWCPQLQETQVTPALTTAPLPTCLLLSYLLPEYIIHVTAPKIRPNLSTGGSQEVRSVPQGRGCLWEQKHLWGRAPQQVAQCHLKKR